MIHIAICDDEEKVVSHLTGLIRQYAAENSEEIKITAYYDGLNLIEKYDTSIDLIFLDIQMKMVDGLHTAERIRKQDGDRAGVFGASFRPVPQQLSGESRLCEGS